MYGTAAGSISIKCVCYHMVSLFFKVFCAVLLGVLPLLSQRFLRATVSSSCSCQSCVKTANADPCTLRLVLVPVHISSVARMGHVPACRGLSSVFGAQQPSRHGAVRCAAGLGFVDTNLLQGPQRVFGSCTEELV